MNKESEDMKRRRIWKIEAFFLMFLVGITIFSGCVEKAPTETTTTSTIIILVRHGETDWNALGILQGQANTTLNDVGVSQMEDLGASWEKNVGLNVDVVYSSPSLRAKQAAEILCKYLSISPFEIKLNDNLQEMGLGILTGVPKAEIPSNPEYLDIYKQWITDLDYAQPSGQAAEISDYTKHYLEGKEFSGESLNTIQTRAWNALNEIVEENKGKIILVSSHGGIIKVILCKVTDTPLNEYSKFSVSNASTTILEFKSDGTVIWVNAPES